MKDTKFDWVIWGVLIGAAIIVIAMCIMITVVPINRSPKATEYELDCLVEDVKKNPLKECKRVDTKKPLGAVNSVEQ